MSEYVGFDVSKEETSFCVKDVSGKILSRGKVATDPAALFEALRDHCVCPSRIVLETGTLSGWLSRELGKLGIAVDVIDARQANAVMKLQHNKTDANDAALLAEIAALTPQARDLSGQTSLLDLVSLAGGAVAAAGNDTGPMHLIAAAACPSVVLYSNESDPLLCGQRGPSVTILRSKTLAGLSVAEVVDAMDL